MQTDDYIKGANGRLPEEIYVSLFPLCLMITTIPVFNMLDKVTRLKFELGKSEHDTSKTIYHFVDEYLENKQSLSQN